MNTILTDDERPKLPPSRYSRWSSSNGLLAFSADQMEAYADAREAAVLAKLAQQADRQRVPDGWKLVPVEPTWEMLEAALDCAAKPSFREAYAAMLAAAPEAPAQNGHLADDERVAALCTLSYAAGMKAGWNYCASEDNEGFERSQKSVGEAIRILKAHRAAAEAPAQASAVDERAAFEAWAKAYGRVFLEVEPKLGRNGVTYKSQFTQEAWVGWQARAALAQKGGAA